MTGRRRSPSDEESSVSSAVAAAAIRDSILLLGSAGGLAFRGASVTTMRVGEYGGGNGTKRGSFFNLQEELMDDDYYDDQMLPGKKRRLTTEQVHLLEKSFEAENKLEPEKKSELAKKLGLQPRQVAVWYQNRRARWKTKQLEHDFDRLKTLYDTLVVDHNSLIADNQRLRSEVVSLTEQLEDKATTQVPTIHGHSPQPPPCHEEAPLVSEFSPSTAAPTPAISSEMKGEEHLSPTINDGRPYNGCSYMPEYVVLSEEDDISDDGGGYFPPVFPEDEAIVVLHDDYLDSPLLLEDVGSFLGWSMWS